MERGALLGRLRATASAAKPGLRVIGLVYTGLGGMLALTLVVSVALVPVGPALQQVAEPARQAVNNLVRPTSDAVTVFFGGAPAIHVDSPTAISSPTVLRGFSEVVSLDVTIEDAPAEPPVADEPIAVAAAPVASQVPSAVAQSPADEAVDEIAELEPIEVSAPHPVAPVVVVVPVPTAGMQIASTDPPKALPTPVPTETAAQMKARLDVENQAAIDAAKAAQVRAKAEADAANNAAIAARKAAVAATASANNAPATGANASVTEVAPVDHKASASAVATPVAATTAEPKAKNSDPATPTAIATPQGKAGANAANQAAIDAAKMAQARAKAEANAANQAAQAAKGAKASVKTTATPTAQPTAAVTPPHSVQPTPDSAITSPEETVAGVTAEGQAQAVSADGVVSKGDVSATDSDTQAAAALLENVPVDQASTVSADGTA